ncbi:acetyl-CoA carboxylase, biotin carboxyl carrier protein, partial [bacterium]|nr:acetyl-CoA carboxylase, biotin carboxyl carrier protein [bacterium]
MDIAKVRELVELVENSKIDELEITSKDATIRIQKSSGVRTEYVAHAPAAHVAHAPVPHPAPEAAAAPAPAPERATWKEVRSPIVGTF